MTKTQKIIVKVAAGLIIIAFLFPPYAKLHVNNKNELTGKWHIQWAFNKDLLDLFRAIKDISFKSSGMAFQSMIINYPLMRKLLFLEIFGILVLVGAALLITKKASRK